MLLRFSELLEYFVIKNLVISCELVSGGGCSDKISNQFNNKCPQTKWVCFYKQTCTPVLTYCHIACLVMKTQNILMVNIL